MSLKVHEIFSSIQGESGFAGWPCAFLRTSGCNLSCAWCDTTYAGDAYAAMSVAAAAEKLLSLGLPLVELTGGEPLLQPEIPALAAVLADAGVTVLVETNGSLDIGVLDPRVVVVMDVKCPGSGMAEQNDYANLDRLRPRDEVKFVLAGREDYLFAMDVAKLVWDRRMVHFSPVAGSLDPAELVAWMMADRVRARLGLQLHKSIWSPDTRGV
jgi:7-carboxy-7-deazaguanine synthase